MKTTVELLDEAAERIEMDCKGRPGRRELIEGLRSRADALAVHADDQADQADQAGEDTARNVPSPDYPVGPSWVDKELRAATATAPPRVVVIDGEGSVGRLDVGWVFVAVMAAAFLADCVRYLIGR